MNRDQLIHLLEREVPRKYVSARTPMTRAAATATAWYEARYTVLETDTQRAERLADTILDLDASC